MILARKSSSFINDDSTRAFFQFALFFWNPIMGIIVLTTKDIVQINATIIAGVLIFMTLALTSFSDKDSSVYRFIITVVTSSVLIPFALSAKVSLEDDNSRAAKWLKTGMVYTVAVAVIFVVLSFLGDIAGLLN